MFYILLPSIKSLLNFCSLPICCWLILSLCKCPYVPPHLLPSSPYYFSLFSSSYLLSTSFKCASTTTINMHHPPNMCSLLIIFMLSPFFHFSFLFMLALLLLPVSFPFLPILALHLLPFLPLLAPPFLFSGHDL